MDKEILKNALFVYSKISVCQYIATMNASFNTKLMAETEAFREERTKLQEKIDALEAELAACKQNACDVGTMLLEAGQYAEQLRQQAQEEVTQLRQQSQTEASELLRQTQEEAAAILLQAQEEAAEMLRQAQQDTDLLRSQTKKETEQFLQEINKKGQAESERIAVYAGAIRKIREDMAILASRTDDALNAFMEQFLGLRQNFEDNES